MKLFSKRTAPIWCSSLMLLASCADESPFKSDTVATGEGKISLNLTSSSDVETKIPKVRAEATTTTITAPPASEFKIRLSKTDGSYAKTWSSMEEFAKEEKFSIGIYQLEAWYGDPDAQGLVKAGEKSYQHAYYYGVCEEVIVAEGEDTPVQLRATLGNAIVLVEYTDAYKNYFAGWNTTLQTEGKEDVEIGSYEGMTYVTPGNVDIKMDAVLQNGKTIFLNPAAFLALPQHMYKVTYDVYNGEVGDASLSIVFDDDVEDVNNVSIELSDEFLDKEAPVVEAVGFVNNETIETQVGLPLSNYDKEIKFSIVAPAELASAKLSVISTPGFKSSFLTNGVIDLCEATEDQQNFMAQEGVVARGFFNEPGQMAYLDLTEFAKTLPAGKHEISLSVTDKLGKTNEEKVAVTLSSVNTNIFIKESYCLFGNGYADITVDYDGPDPTIEGNNPISFNLQDPNTGNSIPVDILAIGTEEKPLTKAEYITKEYVFRVSVPDVAADHFPTDLLFNNVKIDKEDKHDIKVEYPEYKLEFDAFAKKLKLRIADLESDAAKRKLFTNRLRVFIGNEEKVAVKDPVTGIVTVDGLVPGVANTVSTSLKAKETLVPSEDYLTTDQVQAENELPVPNGDFKKQVQTINTGKIDIGGQYQVDVFIFRGTYQNYSSILINEAENWASLNQKTCYTGSSNKNTWYMVPSSFVDENNIYTVRTVGYNHAGPQIAKSGGQFETDYYCLNTPTKGQLNISAGELFLGSYTFNTSEEKREDGVSFTTRPEKLKFNYQYMPYGNDEAYVSIILKDSEGVIIAQNNERLGSTTSEWKFDESTLGSDFTEKTISLPDYEFCKKATKLEIKFISSVGENIDIYIPKDRELSEGVTVITNENNRTIGANKYHAYSKGSVLKVSNLTFEY